MLTGLYDVELLALIQLVATLWTSKCYAKEPTDYSFLSSALNGIGAAPMAIRLASV